ncbi:MAG TPA: DJ-1/PfpI family protein [Bradyrhizobium sp.]|uniref:DJ-1/PfpI family protein n=1 Tax=Bradyrhizobium sp. TaxID=376 RepID=UPI002D7F0916|nr:DJ-1/PfpI family protein [Bradyrhizobium sp.]HET7887857.1 DJ-1/PfpI family protein [Bradyrhizobium sp.]
MTRMRFGIFIYDGVEPIDLATFGVLSMARRIAPEISIVTIAPHAGEIALANGLKVSADYGIDNAPPCDIVIVTGGPGWTAQAKSPETLDYIRRVHVSSRIASVCTGGMILAASGVLDGGPATTKIEVVPPETSPAAVMRETYPAIDVHEAMLVERGDGVVTGGGVTLCIDTTLHLLSQMLGEDVASETARIMEYSRAWRANREAFAPMLAGSGRS